MRKTILFITAFIMGAGIADAAVRDPNSTSRSDTKNTINRQSEKSSTTTQKKTTARNTASNTVARTTSTNRTASRSATTARATKSATTARTTSTNQIARTTTGTSSRTASLNSTRSAIRPARATVTLSTPYSNTFGTGYNTCRDAYFTCMDQFCGTANDTYRRCICSSKLTEIQSREHALTQASDQLQNFQNLNLAVIDKSATEVNAMLSASTGEYSQSNNRDKSDSATQLAGISEILSKTKNKSLSTQGTLDIAGDINAIWATTSLTGGTNIANLTGEALYNAVHAQCAKMVINKCPDTSTQNMVVSAYGMYIENDCSLLINELDKKLTNANSTIRATEREMNLARLENYNAHNSTSINDCIAQVRTDITADTVCGTDYIHCLDITGRYLNYETGEPIYSPNFYQLESQISLSGNILTNQTNRLLVATLNNKRDYASRGLDTCRDLADEVWDEFVRQAITEIYQGQQERIRQVKTECLDVVNTCYDEQNKSLKDFSNIKEQLLLGSRLELSEQMCQEKLTACSNLYGGGSHGMSELVNAMHDITNQKIANQCQATLLEYAHELCAVPGNDTLHAYPFACRVYAPGDQIYATNHTCNTLTQNTNTSSTITPPVADNNTGGNTDDNNDNNQPTSEYFCNTQKIYSSCNAGYYMSYDRIYNSEPKDGNDCKKCIPNATCNGGTNAPVCISGYYLTFNGYHTTNIYSKSTCSKCPDGYTCDGGNAGPVKIPVINDGPDCGTDYIGSLYHKMARYALQACVRPSEATNGLPQTVLQDINMVMDQIRTDMANELSRECERLNGTWVDTIWIDDITDCSASNFGETDATKIETARQKCIESERQARRENRTTPDGLHDKNGHSLHKKFYSETSANTKWGYCATDTGITTGTTTSTGNNTSSNPSSAEKCAAAGIENVTLTLKNTYNLNGCCPVSDVSVAEQKKIVKCGEIPVMEQKERATCTTNPKCRIRIYSNKSDTTSAPAGLFFVYPDGDGPTSVTKSQTLYSWWELAE